MMNASVKMYIESDVATLTAKELYCLIAETLKRKKVNVVWWMIDVNKEASNGKGKGS